MPVLCLKVLTCNLQCADVTTVGFGNKERSWEQKWLGHFCNSEVDPDDWLQFISIANTRQIAPCDILLYVSLESAGLKLCAHDIAIHHIL